MPEKTLAPKESGFGGGPTSIRERNECQKRCLALKEGGFGGGPTSIREGNECQ